MPFPFDTFARYSPLLFSLSAHERHGSQHIWSCSVFQCHIPRQRWQEKKNRKIRCCKFYTNIHFCTRIPISVRTLLFIYGWTIHLIPPCSVRGGCRHFSVVSSHRLLLYIIRLRRCLCREDAMDHTAGPPSLWADSASDCRYLLLPSSLPM